MRRCYYRCIFVSIVLTTYYVILINKYVWYGCNKSTAYLCPDWNEKVITYSKYSDITTFIEENCNCNICIDSSTCNCNALKCQVIGTFGDNNCIITHNYKLTGLYNTDKVSYKTKWDFDILNDKFALNQTKKYYINNDRLNGLCMDTHDVEKVGNVVYLAYILAILFGMIFVTLCLLFCWTTTLEKL